MGTIRIDARLHPAQATIHRDPARFKVVGAGRRFGKTRLGVLECLDVAAQGGRAWWVAPSYRMSEVGWRPLRRMGQRIGAEVRKVDRQILLPNGGEVAVRSADTPDSLRGEGLDFVVMDECAYISEEAWTEAIRPALSDRLGKAMFISTPAGRNWFYRLYHLGQSDQGGEWRSWRFPTSDNPYIAASEIEAARGSLPDMVFRQEYLAEFLENEGSVFRNIGACLVPDDQTPEMHAGHQVVMGVDWGKHQDFTVLSVFCQQCGREVAIDRFNQIDYAFQRGRLKALSDKWHAQRILAETNAMGEPIVEQLHRDGLPVTAFDTTATSKPPLIESLALAFEREEAHWIDNPVATAELEAYERKVAAVTGRSSYSAPAGMHDDTVMARALAWRAVTQPRGVFMRML
jgi:hypothetical protein